MISINWVYEKYGLTNNYKTNDLFSYFIEVDSKKFIIHEKFQSQIFSVNVFYSEFGMNQKMDF